MDFNKIKISELVESFSIISPDYLVVNKNDKQSTKLSFQNFITSLTSKNLEWSGNIVFTGNVVLPPGTEKDPVFLASPAGTITYDDIERWDEAYSWGDHAVEGYVKAHMLPSGYIMPGDNVSLLTNDPPYVTEAELNSAIDGLDFITVGDLDLILDGGDYLKEGDSIRLLDNDVPYLTEGMLRCVLDGNTVKCNPDPTSNGYLKKAVNNVPVDKVSELENDVPYITEASFINLSSEFLKRRDSDGNFRDDNVELSNGMGYLEHTWDGAALIDYDIEILSNVNVDTAYDGEVLTKKGDEWVASSPSLGVSGLHFEGTIDVGLPYSARYTTGSVLVQHHISELSRIPQPSWNFLIPPANGAVNKQQYMILLESGQWVLCGQWNEQLQSDWTQADVWHPSYIRNKPSKLSDIDPSLPDVIGDGTIAVTGGDGVTVTGNAGTANQTGNSEQKIGVNIKPGSGIEIDGNGQLNIDWDAHVGNAPIELTAGQGIKITSNTPTQDPPTANQFCRSEQSIALSNTFIAKLLEIDINADNIKDLENIGSIKLSTNFSAFPRLT